MRLRNILPLLFALSFCFVSCEEDAESIEGCMDPLASNYNPDAEVEGSCSFDLATVLQSRVWRMASVYAYLEDIQINVLEIPDVVPECYQDNLLTFGEDNSLSSFENELICTDEEVSLVDLSGSWYVDGTILTVVNENEVYELPASSLTSSQINLSFSYQYNDDILLPAIITLEAI